MDSSGLRTRAGGVLKPTTTNGTSNTTHETHPGRLVKHGTFQHYLLMLGFATYFIVTALVCVRSLAYILYDPYAKGTVHSVHFGQLVMAPIYFVNQNYYYAYMAWTKQNFGLMLNCITQWFTPITIRISAEGDVADQMKLDSKGCLQCDFPHRMVQIANHQIYTDWMYLWWISYTSRMHGHLYIVLKESLKYLPVAGPGMMFFGFIFMARDWAQDKPRLEHRLRKLNSQHDGPMSGPEGLDPMWLLLFPEGTNLSKNGRAGSAKWAQKVGLQDLRHCLLPRSTGLQFCLQELEKTVDWVYDCTIAYEGVPRGEYGQDIFTLRGICFQGQRPKSVNMYWRRFAMSSIPIHDAKAMDLWVRERWIEKDELLEHFIESGRFPSNGFTRQDSSAPTIPAYLETEVKQRNPIESLGMYIPPVVFYLVLRILAPWVAAAWRMLAAK